MIKVHLAPDARLRYTLSAGTEDRATLRSDLSAELGEFTVNVTTVANLRAGPGTDHAILGATRPGELLTIVATNSASDWLQLANGSWIAATLVSRAPATITSPATLVSSAPATVTSQRKASVPTDVPGALSSAEAAYLQRVAEPMEWLIGTRWIHQANRHARGQSVSNPR